MASQTALGSWETLSGGARQREETNGMMALHSVSSITDGVSGKSREDASPWVLLGIDIERWIG